MRFFIIILFSHYIIFGNLIGSTLEVGSPSSANSRISRNERPFSDVNSEKSVSNAEFEAGPSDSHYLSSATSHKRIEKDPLERERKKLKDPAYIKISLRRNYAEHARLESEVEKEKKKNEPDRSKIYNLEYMMQELESTNVVLTDSYNVIMGERGEPFHKIVPFHYTKSKDHLHGIGLITEIEPDQWRII